MSEKILGEFRNLLKKYSIGVLNLIPSSDWKAVKFVAKDGFTFNAKTLSALINYCDKNKVEFYITTTHVKNIDIVLLLKEPAVQARLSTIEISDIAKVFKSNKKSTYTLREEQDEDVFIVSVRSTNINYQQLKNLIKIYKKNKIDFHVTADENNFLFFRYSKKEIEESGIALRDSLIDISYMELVDTLSSNLDADKINRTEVISQFRNILKQKTTDALYDLNKNIDFIISKAKG